MDRSGAHEVEPVEVEFDLTMEDSLTVAAEASLLPEHRSAVRRYRLRLLRHYLVLVVNGAVLVALFLWFVVQAREPEMWYVYAGGVALCAVGAVASAWPMKSAQRRYTQWAVEHAASRIEPSHFSHTRMWADSEGLSLSGSDWTRTFSWSTVDQFECTPRYALLRLDDGSSLILPRSSASDEELDRLQTLCERCASGEQAVVDRVTAALALRDLACPQCSYPCRGVKDARCPECGRRVLLTDLVPTSKAVEEVVDEVVARARKNA